MKKSFVMMAGLLALVPAVTLAGGQGAPLDCRELDKLTPAQLEARSVPVDGRTGLDLVGAIRAAKPGSTVAVGLPAGLDLPQRSAAEWPAVCTLLTTEADGNGLDACVAIKNAKSAKNESVHVGFFKSAAFCQTTNLKLPENVHFEQAF